MNVCPNLMEENFKEKKWDYLFDDIKKIATFIASNKFNIRDDIEDYVSEACLSAWEKILQNKVQLFIQDKNGKKKKNNLMAFFWKNSWFKISDIIRAKNKKEQKIKFVSLEGNEFLDYQNKFN